MRPLFLVAILALTLVAIPVARAAAEVAQSPSPASPAGDSVLVDAEKLLAEAREARQAKDLDAAREKVVAAIDRLLAAPTTADEARRASVLEALGTLARQLGNLRKSADALRWTLAFREKTLPDGDAGLQGLRQELAFTVKFIGDLQGALALQEKILSICERDLPDDHPDVQRARNNLGNTLYGLGQLQAARALQEKVLAIREKSLPPDHLDLQRARGNLALTLFKQGDIPRALELQERVLEILERTLPPEHNELQGARMNLGVTVGALGDLGRARTLQEKVLAVWEKTLRDDHPDLQKARSVLANTLAELGDLRRARTIEERVLSIRERTLPPDHPDVMRARGNLASTLMELGDPASARKLAEQMLAAAEKTLPDDHPDVQTARTILARVLFLLGEVSEAGKLQEKVLEIQEKTLPENHPNLLVARGDLSVWRQAVGDLRGAREMQESLLAVQDKIQTGERVAVEWTLALLAATLAEIPDIPALTRDLGRLADALSATLERENLLSSREQMEVASSRAWTLSTLLRFAPRCKDEKLDRRCFALVEQTRENFGRPRLPAIVAQDPELAAKDRSVRELRIRLNDLVAGSSRAQQDDPRLAQDLARLVRERDQAERELGAALAARGLTAPLLDPDAIARALRPGECAVGYHRYAMRNGLPGPGRPADIQDGLLAHVLKRDGTIVRVELGPIEPVELAAERWRAAIGKPLERGVAPAATGDEERAAGLALRRLVLDPVLEKCGDAKVLRVCSDDAMHLVPIEALPLDPTPEHAPGAPTCVGERTRILHVTSLGRLLRAPSSTSAEASLLAVGGVDFNAKTEEEHAAPEGEAAEGKSDRVGPLGMNWGPLSRTRAEAENLGDLFEGTWKRKPTVLTGRTPTKEKLRECSRGATFVHIATHGYFVPEDVRSTADPLPGGRDWLPMTNLEVVAGLAPMTLCGLALAGANRGPDALGRVPGVLTAEELASFDLSACELAVLSACETNVGISRAGQGILSLQTALHAAGARTAITSLWKVDDEATRELFEDFYTRIWVKKQKKSDALWNAQMGLRSKGAPTRDWAAWVLTGDPD